MLRPLNQENVWLTCQYILYRALRFPVIFYKVSPLPHPWQRWRDEARLGMCSYLNSSSDVSL